MPERARMTFIFVVTLDPGSDKFDLSVSFLSNTHSLGRIPNAQLIKLIRKK